MDRQVAFSTEASMYSTALDVELVEIMNCRGHDEIEYLVCRKVRAAVERLDLASEEPWVRLRRALQGAE